jgi:carbon-monoxide dehydrogenase medium subunit
MTVLDAECGVTDGRSERTLRPHELAVTYFTTSLAEDELITWVRLPLLGAGWGWGFAELSRRRGDFAVAAAAVIARCAEGVVIESRVAVAGVADRPLRLAAVEAAVDGSPASELDHRIGPIENIEPVSDTMASAAYRRHVARVLVLRALRDACARSEGIR